MLLFNRDYSASTGRNVTFKNILCYCSTLLDVRLRISLLHLKTSYVIVQLFYVPDTDTGVTDLKTSYVIVQLHARSVCTL